MEAQPRGHEPHGTKENAAQATAHHTMKPRHTTDVRVGASITQGQGGTLSGSLAFVSLWEDHQALSMRHRHPVSELCLSEMSPCHLAPPRPRAEL